MSCYYVQLVRSELLVKLETAAVHFTLCSIALDGEIQTKFLYCIQAAMVRPQLKGYFKSNHLFSLCHTYIF